MPGDSYCHTQDTPPCVHLCLALPPFCLGPWLFGGIFRTLAGCELSDNGHQARLHLILPTSKSAVGLPREQEPGTLACNSLPKQSCLPSSHPILCRIPGEGEGAEGRMGKADALPAKK